MERTRYNRGERPNISTVGIVVSDWTYYKRVKQSQTALKSITFMTWDFSGQEEYYATHQYFLSRRSLYLVVWNATHGMKGAEEIKPWLLNIQVRLIREKDSAHCRDSLSLSFSPPSYIQTTCTYIPHTHFHHMYTHEHTRTQARAPHSPVVIVGTHEDKLNSRMHRELEQAKEYINKTYGTLEKRKEGFPQVSLI